jgi:hypothetical protein
MTALYTVVTLLVSFYKADFVNLTVCMLAIYLLVNADVATQDTFRVLVLMVLFSLVYDIIWFFLRNN